MLKINDKITACKLINILYNKVLSFTSIHYIVCGLISASIYFLILFLLHNFLFVSNTIFSVSISFLASSSFNFFYNRIITFNSIGSSILFQLLKYSMMLLISYIIHILFIYLLHDILYIDIFISSFITICITTIIRYYISLTFVYK